MRFSSTATERASTADFDVDHLQAYQSIDLPWPPVFDAAFEKASAHLPRRQQESAWWLMAKYQLEEETVHDLNMSHAWGSDTKVGLCPCLASTSRLWLRVRARDVVGPESMAIQGFDFARQLTTADGAPAAQRYSHPQRIDLAENSFFAGSWSQR